MKTKILLLSLIAIVVFTACSSFSDLQKAERNVVTISGKVTDFEGIAIDSAVVQILHSDFTTAYEAYTDRNGKYSLKNIRKGKYAAMYVIRPKEYPRKYAVEEKDMRLEFWGWNIIADRDLIINPRYHKLELYGTTIFEEYGGRPELLIYFRPMSVTKNISHGRDIYLNKSKLEEVADLSVSPEYLDVEVYAGEEPLNVNSIQPIYDYKGNEKKIISYLLQVDRPKIRPDKPYVVFKIVATNREFNEKGENIYFYEVREYN